VAESKGISFCKRRRVNNCCRDKKNSLPAKNTENPWQSQREFRFANGEGLIIVAEMPAKNKKSVAESKGNCLQT
jgi:hypothetical protein